MPMQDKLLTFFSGFKQQSYKDKSIILSPTTSEVSEILFLEHGFVRMYAIGENGEELSLHIFRPGAYFPLMLVLADEKNTYYFEAINDVTVRRAPKEKVIAFLHENEDVLFELTKGLAGGINGYLLKTERLLLHDAYRKVVSLLLYLGENFGKQKGDALVINMDVTHYFISTWLGLTRETVSRQMRKLENSGLLETSEQTITITNLPKLQQEFEFPQED